jgi:two-component system, NarL family, nitrate/nitrite response regulator NarL
VSGNQRDQSKCAQRQNGSIIIVGQQTLMRAGVVALLQNSPYKVVASLPSASMINASSSTSKEPQLAIVTSGTRESELAENIQVLRARFPVLRIIVVAATDVPVDYHKVSLLGVNGYLADVRSREILLKSLDLASSNHLLVVAPRTVPVAAETGWSGKLRDNDDRSSNISTNGAEAKLPLLSNREQQIIYRLVRGDSNKHIARLLSITESTVKVHLKTLLQKITARNRTQAAIWALANGYSKDIDEAGAVSALPSKESRLTSAA